MAPPTGRHYRATDVISRKGDRCEGLCIVLSGRVQNGDHLGGRSRAGSEGVRTRTYLRGHSGVRQSAQPRRCGCGNGELDRRGSTGRHTRSPETSSRGVHRRHPTLCVAPARVQTGNRGPRTPYGGRACGEILVDHARGAHTLVEESANRRLDYTQDEIAAMVGSVREVVQRALKTLDHAGPVESERRTDSCD